jgi:hypothetical protein
MPLLSYFVVVGSALMALIYLVGAVMPHDDAPIYISSQIEGLPAPRQQARTDDPISRLNPATSYAAAYPTAPSTVDAPRQDINTSATPASQDAPPKKRKRAPRQREWQEDFAQAGGDRRQDDRRWFEQRRRDDGWRDRDRGWRDQRSRDRGWRDPFWGSNRRW